MNPNPWLTKIVIILTAFALSGVPAMAQATAWQPDQQAPATSQDTNHTNNGTVDPAAGPKTPVPSSQLPDTPEQATPAPQAQPATATATNGQSSSSQAQQSQEPLGTATAQRGNTAGGPASKPAGMAIAPAKQKQKRGLLIKIGAVAAAGAALGLVYGLTRSTPSTPPGATAATNRHR